MRFPHGQTVFRDRRALALDEYSGEQTRSGDWDPSLTIALEGAWVASSSSSATSDASRSQVLTAKSLYLTDPAADVQPLDRIRDGGTAEDLDSGTHYAVEVVPEADTNPFTGWQPVKEVPLENVRG